MDRPYFYNARNFALFSFFLIILIADVRLFKVGGLQDGPSMIYERTAIFYNYFEAGFFRRGLSGTVLRLLGDPTQVKSQLYFHIASSAWLAIPVVLLLKELFVKRGGLIASFYLFALAATPFAFRGWASDVGRADMLAFGFVAWSVLALLNGRPYIAAILIPVGALCHEAAAIYGAPLLIALDLAAYQKNPKTGRTLLSAALLMLILVFATYFAGNYATNPEKFLASARAYYSKMLPAAQDPTSRFELESGLYFILEGTRALKNAICTNFLNERHPWDFALVVPTLIVATVLLGIQSKKALAAAFFCVLAPAIFLSVIAIDLGRWLKMGFFSAWLLAVALIIIDQWEIVSIRKFLWLRLVIFAFLSFAGVRTFVIPYYSLFSTGYYGDLLTDSMVGPKKYDPQTLITQCDPTWIEDLRAKLTDKGNGEH